MEITAYGEELSKCQYLETRGRGARLTFYESMEICELTVAAHYSNEHTTHIHTNIFILK